MLIRAGPNDNEFTNIFFNEPYKITGGLDRLFRKPSGKAFKTKEASPPAGIWSQNGRFFQFERETSPTALNRFTLSTALMELFTRRDRFPSIHEAIVIVLRRHDV